MKEGGVIAVRGASATRPGRSIRRPGRELLELAREVNPIALTWGR